MSPITDGKNVIKNALIMLKDEICSLKKILPAIIALLLRPNKYLTS